MMNISSFKIYNFLQRTQFTKLALISLKNFHKFTFINLLQIIYLCCFKYFMKKLFAVLFFGFYLMTVDAQIMRQEEGGGVFKGDSTTFKNEVQIKLSGETKYTDYKIISINNDTTLVDTTLTISKDYKFNYIRKDNFELLAFANQGQTFNKLGYNFTDNSLFPTIGANAKHYNYYKVEDVYYYDVPTPTSESMYRTGMEQGQVLDGFL